MALFPDGMVCGFRPADRSNGGRDETHTHTHTHTHTQWLLCCLTWITQTHSVTLTFHTLPHTPERKTNFVLLCLCARLTAGCETGFGDKMSHEWTDIIMKPRSFVFIMLWSLLLMSVILFHWLMALSRRHVFFFSSSFFPSHVLFPLSCSAPTTGGECIHFHLCGGAGCKAVISDCVCERGGRWRG